MCGASVTGSEHLRRGLGCDDAYGYGTTDDFVVAVIADGAGSVSGTSAWGSYAACQSVLHQAMGSTFIRSFKAASPDDADEVMRWLFDGALAAVGRQADAFGLPLNQLATTLCIAVATPRLTIFGQIGDGIIASESKAGIRTHLIEEKGEYANATWFVQSEGAFEESFRTSAHDDLTAFALSTDGMTYKITNIVTGEPYEPFFAGSWNHVRSGANAADFAALLRGIEDDQTGDDKTVVLAALQWSNDEFRPSARPVQTTVVSSAPPPLLPTIATSRDDASFDKSKRRAPQTNSEPPADAVSIVDHGTFVEGRGRLASNAESASSSLSDRRAEAATDPARVVDEKHRKRHRYGRRRSSQR
ncbi:MAG TPA: PP2C family serine/threonine-protein phosphatase [Mycobacterium sp.]|nr:PP2C family serine/threonine-protein phosphatase [Mycobacterium sp.]